MIWYNVSREIVVDMYGLEVRKAQTLNVKEKRLQFLKLVDPILDLCLGSAFLHGAGNQRTRDLLFIPSMGC